MGGTEFVFPPEWRDKAYKLDEIDVMSASEVIPLPKASFGDLHMLLAVLGQIIFVSSLNS